MVNSYSKKEFQKDLRKLAKLINAFPKTSQFGGKRSKNGKLVKMRTFEVVKVNGKDVKPHGNYQIKEESKVGPEVAATKAAKMMCRKIKKNGGKHTECQGRTLVIREKTSGSAHKHYGPYEVVVSQLTPKESQARTKALRDLTERRLVKQGKSAKDAKKESNKISKVTHKVDAKVMRK